ncbi:MAG: hypothetical protein NTW29_21100 [Bacteroidetes bacterium]|nr:hypothetical protein [Bacteroidota bacterium]
MFNQLDLRLLKENDVFLVPICFLLIWAFAYQFKKKYENTEIGKYFFPALFFRLLFVFIYAMIIQFYYGYGDTSLYYQAVLDMQNSLSNDFSGWKEIYFKLKLDVNSPHYLYFLNDNGGYTNLYMMNLSNYMVPRFALPFSLIFSGSYICICFCLSLYSFAGCWRVYRMFYEMFPRLHRKLAIAILFLPSILFWGGSLLKDSICMGSMGFMLYAVHKIIFKKEKIVISLIIAFVTGFLLFNIKPYILLCILPAFILWVFLQYKNRIKDKTLRQVAAVLFSSVSLVVGFFVLQAVTQSEIAAQYSTDKLLQTVQGVQGSFSSPEGSGSNFTVGSAGNSVGSLIALYPLGVVATLFRPYLWESGSPLMFLTGLEAFAMLYLTLLAMYRIGFKGFFQYLFSDSVLVFCFVYTFMFAGIVGITTTNFGALARYKIPCLPFYLFMIFIIMDKSGKFSPRYVFSKKFF